MADRMSERAKVDLDAIIQQLYSIAPEVDKLAAICGRALQQNVDADGDYISQRSVKALSDIQKAISFLYASGHAAMTERDRFFGGQKIEP